MAQQRSSGEDRFVETTLRLLAWAQRNSRALILGLGVLAVLGFAAKYYLDYRGQLRNAAASEIRSIRMELQSGNETQVVDQLRSFLIQFDGTEYAREARLLLAHALLLQNRAQEAIEPARRAAENMGDDPLSNRAALLLAAAYEEVGDTLAAIRTYEQLGERAEYRILKSRAWEGAARLRAARGDSAGAAAVYERLAELTPEDAPARAFYEMRAAELRADPLRERSAGNEAGTSGGG